MQYVNQAFFNIVYIGTLDWKVLSITQALFNILIAIYTVLSLVQIRKFCLQSILYMLIK